jgi:protein AroM
MPKRVAFVTIGQSPRNDVVPDILAETRVKFEATERGALDGLDDATIADLAPRRGEERLVSRLRDGREVLLGKPAIDGR